MNQSPNNENGLSDTMVKSIALAGIRKTMSAAAAGIVNVKYVNVSPADTNKQVVQINIDKTTGTYTLADYA